MNQVFNGTPVPIKAMAEGQSYWFEPGEIKEIREDHRVQTLLNNFGAVGLRVIQHGDDLDEIAQECKAALCVHMLNSIQDVKQYQLDQASQGLKLLRDSSDVIRQHKRFGKLYAELTGETVETSAIEDGGGDAQLGVIRNLAQVVKNLGNGPMADKAKSLLSDLVAAEKQKIEDPMALDLPAGPVAAVKNRARRGRK